MPSVARIVSLPLLLIASASLAASPPSRPLIIGDAGNELRTPEGRVDVQRTVDRLAELGVNTYLYQVWHGKQDWDDFPAFADAAAKRHIDVWVYLVPWSETTLKKKNWNYSEPFKVDYVAWADAIGKASARGCRHQAIGRARPAVLAAARIRSSRRARSRRTSSSSDSPSSIRSPTSTRSTGCS
jgi:hypothetical protein